MGCLRDFSAKKTRKIIGNMPKFTILKTQNRTPTGEKESYNRELACISVILTIPKIFSIKY
jgi:hypothetical protein